MVVPTNAIAKTHRDGKADITLNTYTVADETLCKVN